MVEGGAFFLAADLATMDVTNRSHQFMASGFSSPPKHEIFRAESRNSDGRARAINWSA
ncbi:hypothetical protein D3C73_1488100 [compost metagenome]